MLKFKKTKGLDIWTTKSIEGDSFDIIKDTCDNKFIVYVNGDKYAVAGTLATAKKYANERGRL